MVLVIVIMQKSYGTNTYIKYTELTKNMTAGSPRRAIASDSFLFIPPLHDFTILSLILSSWSLFITFSTAYNGTVWFHDFMYMLYSVFITPVCLFWSVASVSHFILHCSMYNSQHWQHLSNLQCAATLNTLLFKVMDISLQTVTLYFLSIYIAFIV